MKVFLVNPSDMSFGIAVITPRWLFVLAAATPARFGDPVMVDETLERMDLAQVRPGDVVGIGVHTGNALRGYEVGRLGAGGRRDRDVRRHSRHVVSRRSRAKTASGHAIVRGDGDIVWARVLEDCVDGRAAAAIRGRPGAPAISSCRRAGICCRRAGTCGPPSRPCAAARSTARSVRCGAPTARSRGCAPSTPCSTRSSSCAAQGFPVHRARRRQLLSRGLKDLEMAARRADKTQSARARGDARRALRADGAARQAAVRHGVLHADHDGSGRGSRVPRRDAQGATSRARSSASKP